MIQPKVSIIIPFYSNVDWLEESIESVLNQTYRNYEIILVNDGSKEDLSCFLAKYAKYITYIEQPNQGPAAARNNGIRHSTGELIAFQDSDDIWLPTKLAEQVSFMIETDTMWSHTGFYYWYPGTGKLTEVNCSRDYDDISIQRMVSTQIATPSVMINRRVFDIGDFYFPESVRNGEDDQLYTRLARNFPISFIEEPLVKVRIRGFNSNGKAIERFNLRVANYNTWKRESIKLTPTIHLIYSFYRLYAKLFPQKSNKYWDVAAKIVWTLPYVIERIYIRYLFRHGGKDSRLIKHKSPSVESL